VNDAFEETLSKLVGDIVAHRIAGSVAALAAWQEQAGHNLGENLAEYLTEEYPVLVARTDIDCLTNGIAGLNERLDRLDQQLNSHKPR
jgi:ubiquinone biosynthesis protein UbiJ